MTIQRLSSNLLIRLGMLAVAALVWFVTPLVSEGLSDQYIRTDFTVEAGLPDNVVNSIVQTRNGILWVGTQSGLASFDGREFTPIALRIAGAPPQGAVHAMIEAANGDLWVGTQSGVVLIPKRAVDSLNPSDAVFYPLGMHVGIQADSLYQGQDGVIWAGTPHGLYRMVRGSFVQTISGVSVSRISGALDGHLFLITQRGFLEWNGEKIIEHPELAERLGVHDDQIFNVSQDRDGTIWYCTNAGVKRLALHPVKDLEPQQVAQTAAYRTYQDPQGFIWVATGIGLYRVRDNVMETPAPLVNARCFWIGEDGELWLGTNGNGLVRLKRRVVRMFTNADGLPNNLTMAVLPTRDGKLWIGSNCGLSMFDGNRFTTYREIDGLLNSCVWALAEDHKNGIWIGTYGGGLFQYSAGRFAQYSVEDGLVSTIVSQITVARDGTLWVATPDGISHLQNGRSKNFTVAQGLSSNQVSSVYEDRGGTIWAETQGGIDRLEGDRFVPFSTLQNHGEALPVRMGQDSFGDLFTADSPKGISLIRDDKLIPVNEDLNVLGIVESPQHELWLSSKNGILHVSPKDLSDSVNDHAFPLDYQLFDTADGLNSTQAGAGSPNIAISQDGKLWVATVKGLAMLEISKLRRPSHKPNVFISSVTIERNRQNAQREIVLAPGTHHLELHLDAVDLGSPEKVRIQFRMDGVDSLWLDADSSRTAVYSNIPPGSHLFHVRASTGDGIWDRVGVVYTVRQQPYFFQRGWFQLACVTFALLILYGAYLIRMRQIVRRTQMRLEERITERERIARDLHDTFFQGIQGILLRFHTGTSQLSPNEPARVIFEEALNTSDKVMLEGRELVQDLRTTKVCSEDLPATLAITGNSLKRVADAQFTVIVNGTRRVLHPIVEEELNKIGKEALSNAFHHAHAQTIEAELTYDSHGLRLRVRDDGRGIDPEILRRGHKDGHWGLPGMRERAKKVGANLEVWSHSHAGTEIEIRVPATLAFRTSELRCRGHWMNWNSWRRWFTGGELHD